MEQMPPIQGEGRRGGDGRNVPEIEGQRTLHF